MKAEVYLVPPNQQGLWIQAAGSIGSKKWQMGKYCRFLRDIECEINIEDKTLKTNEDISFGLLEGRLFLRYYDEDGSYRFGGFLKKGGE